jgi:hypothetical protein
MRGKFTFAHAGSSSTSQRRYASRRHSSIHSGSPFLAEIKRMVSSERPLGAYSCSMSVMKPCSYFSSSFTWSMVCLATAIYATSFLRARVRAWASSHASAQRRQSSSVLAQPPLTRSA